MAKEKNPTTLDELRTLVLRVFVVVLLAIMALGAFYYLDKQAESKSLDRIEFESDYSSWEACEAREAGFRGVRNLFEGLIANQPAEEVDPVEIAAFRKIMDETLPVTDCGPEPTR